MSLTVAEYADAFQLSGHSFPIFHALQVIRYVDWHVGHEVTGAVIERKGQDFDAMVLGPVSYTHLGILPAARVSAMHPHTGSVYMIPDVCPVVPAMF